MPKVTIQASSDVRYNFSYTTKDGSYCNFSDSIVYPPLEEGASCKNLNSCVRVDGAPYSNGARCQQDGVNYSCCRLGEIPTIEDGVKICATTEKNPDAPLIVIDGPSKENLDFLNPLNLGVRGAELSSPGGVISRLLLFAFPLAGLLLFLMLSWGGFEILQGATNKKSLDAGKNRIKAAVIGFLLLFMSYWIVEVISLMFGIKVF